MAPAMQVQPGLAFSLVCDLGFAIGVVTHDVPRIGSLIWMAEPTFDEEPSAEETAQIEQWRWPVFFPLQAAIRRKIVAPIGVIAVPSALQEFPMMRSRDGRGGWIEADMCISGEYRLALIPLWRNGYPGCDVSCCPVRRSAGPPGGTTNAPSPVVHASTTPSTVTPLAAGMGLASRSSGSRPAPRCRSVNWRRCSVVPCPRRQGPRWGRRGVRMR